MELSADRPEEARMLLARAAAEVCMYVFSKICMYVFSTICMCLIRYVCMCKYKSHACTKRRLQIYSR
jgi:hypothetical protein